MRSPIDCVHYSRTDGAPPSVPVVCSLIQQITGAREAGYTEVAPSVCHSCCGDFQPSQARLNRFFASHLLRVANRIVKARGADGCSAERATEVAEFARRHMPMLVTNADELVAYPPEYDRPCFYLGEKTDAPPADNQTCTENPTFSCRHEFVGQTTEAQCGKCRYYDPELNVGGGVSSWAVGVLTSPRTVPTVARTLASLAAAGWSEVRVFAEPEAVLPDTLQEAFITRRSEKVLAWPNFLLALWELMLRQPTADAYLLCEDDVVFCRGVREYLETRLWPARRLGAVSLFASSTQELLSERGFYPVKYGWATWGAQALVFPNAAARALVRHPDIVNHRNRGPMDGHNHTDAMVGYWCARTGLDFHLHTPSLAQHIGDTSTLWTNTELEGRRVAATFPGEEADIREVMSRPENILRQAAVRD